MKPLEIYNHLFKNEEVILTLESNNTKKYFSYKINKHNNIYFVSVLYGPDNSNNYKYIGTIFDKNNFTTTKKSYFKSDSISVRAFNIFFFDLMRNKVNKNLNVYFACNCSICGKILTNPESIERKVGKICENKLFNNL